MYSTGPLFLSVIWKEYLMGHPSEMDRIHILMPDEYKKQPWSFFTHHVGNSWHDKDARFIFWVSKIVYQWTLENSRRLIISYH